METIDWTAEFNELTEFEDSQWNNATLEERQEALEGLVDTIDVTDKYKDYTFQTAALPEGDFVALDPESQTIIFDREILENADFKDCIVNDLFAELNIDCQVAGCFENLYYSQEHISYCSEASEQYSEVGDVSYSTDGTQDSPAAIDAPEEGSLKSHGISFGGYKCGMSCKADGGFSTSGTIFWTLRSS